MNRLVAVASGWMLGALLEHTRISQPVHGWPCIVLMALASAVAVWVACGRRVRGLVPLLLFSCGLMATWRPSATPDTQAYVPPAGAARLQVRVAQTQPTPKGPRAIVVVDNGQTVVGKKPLQPGVRMLLYGRTLPLGAALHTIAVIKPWTRFRNPSPHPDWPRAQSQQIVASGWIPPSAPMLILSQSVWHRALQSLRSTLRQTLQSSLDARVEGMAIAWLLGESDFIEEADRQSIQAAGLTHVLAVSGLNITLFAGFIVAVLRRLLLRCRRLAMRYDVRRIACCLGMPLALGYAALAGGTASGWRAALMTAFAWSAIAAARRPTPSGIIAASMLCFGATSPHDAVSPAFLLSVVATVAIITANTHGKSFWITQSLISARSMLATAPLVVWCFGGVPLIGLVSNVLLVPLASYVLMPLCFALAVLGCMWQPAAAWLGVPLHWGCTLFVEACKLFEHISWGRAWAPLSLTQGLLLAVAAFVTLGMRWSRLKWCLLALALVAFIASEWHLRVTQKPRGRLRVTFVDVGQGDAALLDLPDGKLMLIDAGGSVGRGPDPGSRVLLPLLKARRRSHIDVVVITHPHPDHYGGLSALLDQISMGEVWDNGQAEAEDPDGAYTKLLNKARRRGARVLTPRQLCEHSRHFAKARVEILWPCPRYQPALDLNDNSLVLRITHARASYLFTGDIEASAEDILLSRHPDLRAQVLKVAHHGSRTSSTAAFIAAVQPRTAVISAGRFNRFGHPHPEVVARLRHYGAQTLSLATHGGFIVE